MLQCLSKLISEIAQKIAMKFCKRIIYYLIQTESYVRFYLDKWSCPWIEKGVTN